MRWFYKSNFYNVMGSSVLTALLVLSALFWAGDLKAQEEEFDDRSTAIKAALDKRELSLRVLQKYQKALSELVLRIKGCVESNQYFDGRGNCIPGEENPVLAGRDFLRGGAGCTSNCQTVPTCDASTSSLTWTGGGWACNALPDNKYEDASDFGHVVADRPGNLDQYIESEDDYRVVTPSNDTASDGYVGYGGAYLLEMNASVEDICRLIEIDAAWSVSLQRICNNGMLLDSYEASLDSLRGSYDEVSDSDYVD